MSKLQTKRHHNSKRRGIQRKLNNRISIMMAFENDTNWCELEVPLNTRKKLTEDQKKSMKEIK